jgi:MSHA biogenesis protein MshQ
VVPIGNGDYVNFQKEKFDVLLTDAAGLTVDYLNVNNLTDVDLVQSPGCTDIPYPNTYTGTENKFDLSRLPDGTGIWGSDSGNSAGQSSGETNGPTTQTTLSMADVSVIRGSLATFTLSFGGGTISNGISFSYRTVAATASSPADYTYTSGSFNYATGVTMPGSVTVSVPTNAASLVPDGSFFWLEVYNPVNLSVVNNFAKGTITGASEIDHFRIDHAGSALTCQRADVTVRACQTSDCSILYPGPVSITMLPTGWIGGDSQTIAAGAASIFQLRHNSAGTATLGISSPSVLATNPTQCYVGGVPGSCDLLFATSGFVFDVPTQTACQASPAITLSAVKADPADPQACIAAGGFANISKTIHFWSNYLLPATGTKSLQVSGSTVATTAPGTPVTLVFNNSSQSSFNVSYADAGQLRLNARYDGSGEEAGLVMTGSDLFVVKPFRLDILATTDGTTPLDNSSSTGTPIWPAGDNFFVAVKGVCADATVTPNFSAATTLVAVVPFQPATGTMGALTNGAILATDYSAGVASKSNIQYDEVGTVTLKADVADYLASGALSGTSGVIGRFTPHHFLLSGIPTLIPRSNLACVPASTFTYMGEPFKIQFGLEAQNAANGRTNNYTGAYAKLNPATAAPFNFGAVSPGGPTPLTARLDLGLPPVGSWLAGAGNFTITMAVNRGVGVDGPFDDLLVGMAPLDTDNVAYRSADFNLDADLNTSNERIRLATTPLRYGRLALQNAYGSELLALKIPLRAEYYAGTNFVTNPDDSCTPYNGTTTTLDNYLFNLQAGETSASGAGTLLGGAGNPTTPLQLSAPGAGNDGSVDVTLLTDSWLRFDWDGNVGTPDSNPKARASFGIYKGNPRMIYLREVIR